MLVFVRALLVRSLALLLLLLPIWWTQRACAVDAPPLGDELVIDAIDVEGQTGSAVSMVRTIIDLPIGLPLSRAALDQRLAETRLRLLALGYYRDPWLRLERGTTRGHYRLIVQGEAYGSSYYGAGLSRQSSGRTIARALKEERGAAFYDGSVFLGERNYRNQGIWLDGQLDQLLGHTQFNSPSANGTFDVNATNLLLTAFAPNLGGGRYLAGLRLQTLYESINSNFNFDIPGRDGPDHFQYSSHQRVALETAIAQAGVRFGLASVAAVWTGTGYRSFAGPSVDHQSSASYGLKTTYSEKSYLALVEPGLDLQLDALRKLSSSGEPNLNLSALYTWMPGEGFGLTPGYRRQETWDYRHRMDYGNEAYLHLDWVTSVRWALSAEPRWVDGASTPHVWNNGLTLTARYIGCDSLYSLSLVIGEQGLAQNLTPGLRELVR